MRDLATEHGLTLDHSPAALEEAAAATLELGPEAMDVKVDLSDLDARCDEAGARLSGGCELMLGDEVLVTTRGREPGRRWWRLGLQRA